MGWKEIDDVLVNEVTEQPVTGLEGYSLVAVCGCVFVCLVDNLENATPQLTSH